MISSNLAGQAARSIAWARTLRLLPVLLGLSACGSSAQSACVLVRHAHLPLTPHGRLYTVPVEIDGKPVSMLLDTGSSVTVISLDAIETLNIESDPLQHSVIQGVGGLFSHNNVKLRSLRLGNAITYDVSLAVAGVPKIPDPGQPAAGLLGLDVLANYDIDLDIPNRTLDLYDSTGCQGSFAAWKGQYFALPLQPVWRQWSVSLPVRANGVPLRAILDSGASISVMSSASAHAAGERLRPTDTLNRGWGMDMHPVLIYRHSFPVLSIGGEDFRNQPIAVGDVSLPGTDMLLGTDYLQTRRVWISFRHRRVFIQPD